MIAHRLSRKAMHRRKLFAFRKLGCVRGWSWIKWSSKLIFFILQRTILILSWPSGGIRSLELPSSLFTITFVLRMVVNTSSLYIYERCRVQYPTTIIREMLVFFLRVEVGIQDILFRLVETLALFLRTLCLCLFVCEICLRRLEGVFIRLGFLFWYLNWQRQRIEKSDYLFICQLI